MNQPLSPDHLLTTRGVAQNFDAFVVAAAFDHAGMAAFALGDGTLRLLDGAEWRSIAAHDGAVLALAADTNATGFISGGDDGKFQRAARDGTLTTLGSYGMRWVEQVASFTDGKGGHLACAVGKQVHLFDAAGKLEKSLAHPSTVTGLVFDARGKRIGASHYNGASLWFVASKSDNPRVLEWKGSHTAIAISPDGESVVTAMQENALHGWHLPDNKHLRMSGYPGKTQSLSFTRQGRFLATSGSEAVVLWPFTGGGPMGKAPLELAGVDGIFCTRVASHKQNDMVAAGFSNGHVVLVEYNVERILPVCGPGRGSVSALAWSDDGTHLAFGTEGGFTAVVDFSMR